MAGFPDDPFLDVGDEVLGDLSYDSFSESLEEELGLGCPRHLLSPSFDLGTLAAPAPGSPFSFDSGPDPDLDLDIDIDIDIDLDLGDLSPSHPRSPPFWDSLEDNLAVADGFEWEEIADATPGVSRAGGSDGGGGGARGVVGGDVFGFLNERDMLGVMEGIDSGDDDSIFSDEPPFDFDEDDFGILRPVGWEVLPVPLDEDDFEVLPGHLADTAMGGAPPAARAAVERLQIVAVGGDEVARGCAVCKDGIPMGELTTRLPCGHFYHGACIGPWLAIRNSCPVCRYELPTDDPEYERRRARRCSAGAAQLDTPMQI